MDDQTTNENPSKDFNKIDLTQLQGFSFGTQWTQDKTGAREGRREDRPRREGDGEGGAPSGEVKRDRRSFRKPMGSPVADATAPGQQEAAPAGNREFRPHGGEGRGGPRQDRGDFRGGPRRFPRAEGGPGGDQRGPRFDRGGQGDRDRGPYISPFFNVTFYPEDTGFSALAKAVRTSCRTYELFEIAKVIIGKNDRFVAVIQRKPLEGASASPIPTEGTTPPMVTKGPPMAISVPDGLPFENEDAVVAHVLSVHLAAFFDSAEVEVEAPKGNYQVINKCSVTGELLGPPNYHRYNQIVQQHFTSRISRMSLEAYRTRIESVRDPEVINQWLEKMKKVTRYTWKAAAEGTPAPTFDSLEEARNYLLTHAREKVVKVVDSARFHGKNLEQLPQGEIRRALEGTLERQRRFPLDTANALRGRLRREGFTIFKKGSKGVSYVCAVKRKFRIPGQTFSDSIGALISFIEAHAMVKASELPVKFLGIHPPAAAPAAAPAGATVPPIVNSGTIPPMTPEMATALTPEDQAKLTRLNNDLRWLVTEGYVTEFIDGRLFAPPAMTEARKQEVEKSEHDPENFPDVPPGTMPPMGTGSSAPVAAEATASEQEASPVSEQPKAE